ncbi:hypothetical protein CPB86DRAFT_783407 [Serendipita vermifera]|nr:hypothetical protein CPB86DRAFT_783407 [Serendipita vermifera]
MKIISILTTITTIISVIHGAAVSSETEAEVVGNATMPANWESAFDCCNRDYFFICYAVCSINCKPSIYCPTCTQPCLYQCGQDCCTQGTVC